MEELTQKIVAKKLGEVIGKKRLDSRIVNDPNKAVTVDDKFSPFLIVYGWDELETINAEMKPWTDEYEDGLYEWDDLVEYGFSDQFGACSECGDLVETSPTHYGWQPEYAEFEFGSPVCHTCIQENFAEEYIELHVNNARRLINVHVVDPTEYGWVDLELRKETGYHPGQNDDPQAVLNALAAEDIDVIFHGRVGQFDVNWSVLVPEGKEQQAREALEVSSTRFPYDLATELGNALSGKGSKHVSVRKWTAES